MRSVVFLDVDTQRDFMEPSGALYVPGAETIVPRLAALTQWAREHNVQIVATMDDHIDADAEISQQPDFRVTFPPHCMRGSRGQERIEATAPQHPLHIENRVYTRAEMAELLRRHRGEIVIKKQALDVFSNPAAALLVELLAPDTVVVYGVATEFCINCAVRGLNDRKRRVRVVSDAIRAVDAGAGAGCVAEWRRRGVEIVTAAEVLSSDMVRAGGPVGFVCRSS